MLQMERNPDGGRLLTAGLAVGAVAVGLFRGRQLRQARKELQDARLLAHGHAGIIRNQCDEIAELQILAETDEMTGFFNTRGLERKLEGLRPPKALLYVDGTNVKAVNDLIGHHRGDEALIGIANVISRSIRPNDFAARIGGDEFLVVLNDEPRAEGVTERDPEAVKNLVMDRIAFETAQLKSLNIDLFAVGFDIAVGGDVWRPGMTVKNVTANAEAYMYEHKRRQHKNGGQHRPA